MTGSSNSQSRHADVDRMINENLKRAFDNVASEPVPDRFTELLQKLRTEQGSAGGAKND